MRISLDQSISAAPTPVVTSSGVFHRRLFWSPRCILRWSAEITRSFVQAETETLFSQSTLREYLYCLLRIRLGLLVKATIFFMHSTGITNRTHFKNQVCANRLCSLGSYWWLFVICGDISCKAYCMTNMVGVTICLFKRLLEISFVTLRG